MKAALTSLLFLALLICHSCTNNAHAGAKTNLLEKSLQKYGEPEYLNMLWKNKTYNPPDTASREKIRKVVEELYSVIDRIDAAKAKELASKLKGTGYRLKEYNGKQGHWLILEADSNTKAGGGYYIFRLGKLETEIVIQAPHAIWDVHTDVISKGIFNAFPIRAVYFSDFHRYGQKGKSPYKNSEFDLAHNPDTLFQDLTAAAAQKLHKAAFVQLHGYETREKHEGVDFVLSPGTKENQGEWFMDAFYTFNRIYPPEKVRKYPDVRGLGATSNVQGRLLRMLGCRFLHIEITKEMRRTLKDNPAERDKLGKAIVDGLK